MQEPIDLPPEFQHVADLVSDASPQVRDLFRYALVLAMIDDEKARAISTRVENGSEFITVKTITGDEFEILRPEISEEIEAELMKQVRTIVSDDEHRVDEED